MPKRDVDRARRIEIGQERRARTRARIVAAAFDLFGEENGLYVRVEDIAARAGITRPTFYDHFGGLPELREAVTHEVTHDFLIAVTATVSRLDDPRERASAAIRFYLERVRADPRWGWSMINLSANGIIFGVETRRQAEMTVQEGMAAGLLHLSDSAIGRDLVLGTSLAALSTMLRDDPGPDYPARVVTAILAGMGVAADTAATIARRPLPPMPGDPPPKHHA